MTDLVNVSSKENVLNIGGNKIHLLHIPRPFPDNRNRFYARGEDENWDRFDLEWDLAANFIRNGAFDLNDPCVIVKKEIEG